MGKSEKQIPGGSDHFADEKDLERCVREHGAAMYSVARRFLINEDDARECVQQAYLLAFAKISSFLGRSTFRTWLHRIVVNTALGILRSRKRDNTQSIEDLLPKFDKHGNRIKLDSRLDMNFDSDREAQEIREFVRRGIDQLPMQYRTVLMLRDIEGYDTEETAAALEVTPGTVKVRLHRARSALRKILEPMLLNEKL